MANERALTYANTLSTLIKADTVSVKGKPNKKKFHSFHKLLFSIYPNFFKTVEFTDFSGSFLCKLKGESSENPVLFMNHMDVVEASGKWKHGAFSGKIIEGKVWGRGALDNKGGLFAMLQGIEELLENGFVPKNDIYFMSSCTEETDGSGAHLIAEHLTKKNIRFSFVLDEGGMIIEEPLAGTKGKFAMVGVGEKGIVTLKFVATSNGGHSSAPQKNSPLVRLGKFMAHIENKQPFKAKLSPTVKELFKRLAKNMRSPLRLVLAHPTFFSPILKRAIPKASTSAGAMLQTTLAFTMAQGSDGDNVIPNTAYIIGNMRLCAHQGMEESMAILQKIASRYGVEIIVEEENPPTSLTDHNGEAFKAVESVIKQTFPAVEVVPYYMVGASDCRYMADLSDNCLRFIPFVISNAQLDNIHGTNENVNIKSLPLAVDFYKNLIKGL